MSPQVIDLNERNMHQTLVSDVGGEAIIDADADAVACQFLEAITTMTLQMMSHFLYTTVHPCFLSYALEFFAIQHQQQHGRRKMKELEYQYDDDDDSASHWSMQDMADEITYDDDDDLDDHDETNDTDEMEGSLFIGYDLTQANTPKFDSLFPPKHVHSQLKTTLSDESFRQLLIAYMNHNLRIHVPWTDQSVGMFKRAMFAYVCGNTSSSA
eukprot:CAMPEP_0204643218 /NCGR_PEP_ID=MMETSP0718-20130828/529_1 /ASSEMBLY_ACC=CAM_ASM_000674 /TAXON_ID=230516 /ORGANISM="Chaetoceros curvisetus" /LENGTH=211 /DNA_ID=CAMNT_0051664335 /DNA_START=72 /DNA_END=707 /DNA_ORIENTATION=-